MPSPSRFQMFLNYVRPTPEVRLRIEALVAEYLAVPNSPSEWTRVREWFDCQQTGQPLPPLSPLQSACHDIVPGVRATPHWDADDFPFLKSFIENSDAIRSEFFALRNNGGEFQTYRNPMGSSRGAMPDPEGVGELAHDKGAWNVAYLTLHDMKFQNTDRCPVTMNLLRSVPRLFDHALFSVLAPHSHIIAHCGPTNKKLRIHFPLVVPEKCRLRVAEEDIVVEKGKPIVFDDSFVHEAWNDSSHCRAVLLFDIWHPDLSDAEVEFLNLVQGAFEHHLQRQGHIDVAQKIPPKLMNPYSIILSAKERAAPGADVLWV